MMELPVCIEPEKLVQNTSRTINSAEIVGNGGNVTMPLQMRTACEKCGRALAERDVAYICSYECTFCQSARRRWRPSVRIAGANWCGVPGGEGREPLSVTRASRSGDFQSPTFRTERSQDRVIKRRLGQSSAIAIAAP